MKAALEAIWWRRAPPPALLRWLEALYAAVVDRIARRRRASATRLPVPVVIIGNIAIGGTGKTPVTLMVVELLQSLSATPGVLSRGYGGRGPFPAAVTAHTASALAGDEPVLMAQRARVPLWVAPSRVSAGQALLAAHPEVDVLVCDDGLQHYALAREVEICVIDGVRGHGNGHRLPAGPLREWPARAAQCDLLLVNGADAAPYGSNALRFDLVMGDAVPLHGGTTRALTSFAKAPLHALAGIGNPQRFFDALRALGLTPTVQAFADHHAYRAEELVFAGEAPVLLTEKDAVKIRALALPQPERFWVVPVTAVMSQAARQRVQECLASARSRRLTPARSP